MSRGKNISYFPLYLLFDECYKEIGREISDLREVFSTFVINLHLIVEIFAKGKKVFPHYSPIFFA